MICQSFRSNSWREFLLECARQDPALLARSMPEPTMAVEPLIRSRARPSRDLLDGLLALQPRGSDQLGEPELEELVSIAVACARRAEDALEHAREVSATARRRMSMVAAITGMGMAAGIAAMVVDRNCAVADPRLTDVASARFKTWPGDMQKQTVAQLAEVRSNVAAMRDSTPAVQPAAVQLAAAQAPGQAPAQVAPQAVEPAPVAVASVAEPPPPQAGPWRRLTRFRSRWLFSPPPTRHGRGRITPTM